MIARSFLGPQIRRGASLSCPVGLLPIFDKNRRVKRRPTRAARAGGGAVRCRRARRAVRQPSPSNGGSQKESARGRSRSRHRNRLEMDAPARRDHQPEAVRALRSTGILDRGYRERRAQSVQPRWRSIRV